MIFVGMHISISYPACIKFQLLFFKKLSIFISYTKYENTSEHDASTN